MDKNNSRMCARNYSGTKLIVTTGGLMPDPILDPGLAGDW